METPVLKPGGFWICPACGQRNKVWAPCSICGTALDGMAYPEARLASAAPAPGSPALSAARRSWLLYALVAAGVLTAVGLGVVISRVLGGATLAGQEDLAGAGPRGAVSPVASPPAPAPLPSYAPFPRTPPPDVLPATPPAVVDAPGVPAEPPGYSIPAPPPERGRIVAEEPRASADLRARQQAVRRAQARFERAEDALAAAEGGDPERETEAMGDLERAARALREAEAALDRARRGQR